MTTLSARTAILAAVLFSVAIAGCGAAGGQSTAPAVSTQQQGGFDGAALPTPVAAPLFTLSDGEGRSVPLAAYRGRVTILAFLDSSCRACALIAQQVRGALDEVAAAPPVVFVSVDPSRDTPASVAGFLRSVGLASRVRYLVGPSGKLARVLRAYRVVTPARGQALFEAAVTVYLLDAQGRERVVYQEEQLTPEGLAHDIRALASS